MKMTVKVNTYKIDRGHQPRRTTKVHLDKRLKRKHTRSQQSLLRTRDYYEYSQEK